jgi:hypothetical protein
MAYVCGAAQQQSNKFKVFVLAKGRAQPGLLFCTIGSKQVSASINPLRGLKTYGTLPTGSKGPIISFGVFGGLIGAFC